MGVYVEMFFTGIAIIRGHVEVLTCINKKKQKQRNGMLQINTEEKYNQPSLGEKEILSVLRNVNIP